MKLDAFVAAKYPDRAWPISGSAAGNSWLRKTIVTFTPRAREHLRKLRADISAADNQQGFRQCLERQRGGAGQIRYILDAGNGWHGRTRAGRDDDLARLDEFAIDADAALSSRAGPSR